VTFTINLAEQKYVSKRWGDVHVYDVAVCVKIVTNVYLGL